MSKLSLATWILSLACWSCCRVLRSCYHVQFFSFSHVWMNLSSTADVIFCSLCFIDDAFHCVLLCRSLNYSVLTFLVFSPKISIHGGFFICVAQLLPWSSIWLHDFIPPNLHILPKLHRYQQSFAYTIWLFWHSMHLFYLKGSNLLEGSCCMALSCFFCLCTVPQFVCLLECTFLLVLCGSLHSDKL